MNKAALGIVLVLLAVASAPAMGQNPVKTFTVTVEKKRVDIGDGMTYDAWTFNGTVPGPQLRIRQGDEVSVELLNHTPDAHGLNIHAAQLPEKYFGGDTKNPLSYKFRAEVPGVFGYHCNGIPIQPLAAGGRPGGTALASRRQGLRPLCSLGVSGS
jgi:nitrite reductase (NO-forming)